MAERPILFSGPMVRALLDGRKWQTRRIVKDRPKKDPRVWCLQSLPHAGPLRDGSWMFSDVDPAEWGTFFPSDYLDGGGIRCPYGVAGDRLWVRETWKSRERRCTEDDDHAEDEACSEHCQQTYVYYAATPRVGFRPVPDRARITYLVESSPLTEWYTSGWRPSIHMPRWASRLLLEVTEVRVERLQDITEEDARAEGLKKLSKDGGITWKFGIPDRDGLPGEDDDGQHWHEWATDPRKAFAKLWDRINGDRASWASNPWVWVVSFPRLA
jgi:hypothetical protein